MPFQDPTHPMATCVAADCTDCPLREAVHCHFRPKDLAHFLLLGSPEFFIGGAAILAFGPRPLAVWIAIMIGFFGFLEIRVLCAHCPHYAEKSRILGCWANHGSPKLWKYRPGPMTVIEKIIFLGGLALVWGYPLPFFFIGGQWFRLTLYILTSAAFFTTLKWFLCPRCMNFACPLNAVDETIRRQFFQRHPSVAQSWNPPPK